MFVDFDQRMTEEIIVEVTSRLYAIGYNVVACVSDQGSENRGFLRKMGVTPKTPYFLHPITKKKIVYFPDVPHLLKLFRNWLLDTGFILADGTIVTKESLEKLLALISTEINVACRLTKDHIDVKKSQRQNVRLAAQLCSHTVATALIHYGIDPKLGEVIQKVSDWFDVFNVRTKTASGPLNSPYGMSHVKSTQAKILEDLRNLMAGMTCIGKKKNSVQVS